MKQLTQEQIDKLNSQVISTEGLLFEDDVERVEFILREEEGSEGEASTNSDALLELTHDEDLPRVPKRLHAEESGR